MNITEVQSRLLKILSDTINHDKEIKKFIEFVPAPSLESEDKDNSAATKTKAYIIKLNVNQILFIDSYWFKYISLFI